MILLRRSVFGRHLLATGQSELAAYLSGIEVRQVRLLAYMLCGTLAALTGFLLSGFTGGAALNMGDTYLMESIAVVVLGGTSVAGWLTEPLGDWVHAPIFKIFAPIQQAVHALAHASAFRTCGADLPS